MYYPFVLYNNKVKHRPVFPGLTGDPFIADLSTNSPLLQGMDVRDQEKLQRILDEKMGSEYRWGASPYLERRDTLLGDCPQMVAEQRFVHLGLDVIVKLGTPLHAPLDATVAESDYESGEGNYGSYVLLKHESPAYSARFRPPIPAEACHRFRLIPATDSGGSRPPIPDDSGHPR